VKMSWMRQANRRNRACGLKDVCRGVEKRTGVGSPKNC
jgi:hypothetical protein